MKDLYLDVFGHCFMESDGRYYHRGLKGKVDIIGFVEVCKRISDLYYEKKKFKHSVRVLYEAGYFGGSGGWQYACAKSASHDYKKLVKVLLIF